MNNWRGLWHVAVVIAIVAVGAMFLPRHARPLDRVDRVDRSKPLEIGGMTLGTPIGHSLLSGLFGRPDHLDYWGVHAVVNQINCADNVVEKCFSERHASPIGYVSVGSDGLVDWMLGDELCQGGRLIATQGDSVAAALNMLARNTYFRENDGACFVDCSVSQKFPATVVVLSRREVVCGFLYRRGRDYFATGSCSFGRVFAPNSQRTH
ncbi:MAG: hypothetical protein FJX76_18635 [Armatimonadetes bacterium]|nr:hypothetical protein [Armatimonadota bacterium]